MLVGSKQILILCHQNADPDAIGSAYALSRLIHSKIPSINVEIIAPKGINRISKQILQYFPIDIETNPKIQNFDMIILVDTSTLIQLGEFGTIIRSSEKPLILIDHHTPRMEMTKQATFCIINEEASSTCEIVFDLFEKSNTPLDSNIAKALFLGIAYDTRHFIIAKSFTFKIVAKLMNSGIVVEELLPLLNVPLQISERIARLKAAQRLQCIKLDMWLIAYSKVGSYQSSVARGLIALGADVASVGGERSKKLKISLRSSKKFFDVTHIHLGRDIASYLDKSLNGMGGGHNTAAAFNGEGSLDKAFEYCINLLKNNIEIRKNKSK